MAFDISELLTLYEIAGFTGFEGYEELMQQIIEKLSRLLGTRRIALLVRKGGKEEYLGYWGFSGEEEIWKRLKEEREKSFIYNLGNGSLGFLYLEQQTSPSSRDKRLLNIFASRIEHIVEKEIMKEKIKKSEQEREVILDSILEYMVFLDTEQRILWANRAAAEAAGLRPEQLEGRYCYEIWHRRKKACESCPVLGVLKTGEPGEGNVVSPSGRALIVRGYPLKNQKGEIEGVIEVVMDITEHKRAEKAIRESEEALRVVFDNVNDAIFIHESDGTIVEVNAKMLEMYGVGKEEALKLSIIDDYSGPGNFVEQLPLIWEKVLSGKSQLFEWKAKRPKDGSLFDVEIFLNKVTLWGKDLILATVRDITERKREEEFLKKLFIHSPIGIYIARDGKFQFVNPQFEKYTGYKREELLGMDTLNLVVPEDRNMVRVNAIKMLKGESTPPYEFRVIQKNGKVRWAVETVTSFQHGGERAVLGSFMDITDIKEYQKKLAYMTLHDKLTGLYNRTYFEEELNRLSDSREYPITIISADLDGLKFINDTMGYKRGDELLKACGEALKKSLRSSDILARVGGDEFAAVLPRSDEKDGEKIVQRIHRVIEEHNLTHHSLPLSISIGVATAKDSRYSLVKVFKKAEDLMYRDKLYRNPSARSQLVNTLLAALAAKDYITEGHVRRVQELCHKLGKKLGLSFQQLTDLSLLAQFHDLGKVGIPDSILFKEGPLTAEEWEIMRRHPEIGYRIASLSPDLAPIAELILRHHERWDGKGYPLGIRGKDIPVECRILSLVDAFDAMTTDRPYRKAKSREEAMEEIKRCAGSQFDPQVVKKFLEILQKPYQ